ncbi:MAG: PilN domain-containing protein [Betaproteobacteria bacterium]|nr:PilN domain-containing protein [Betaproteobacteria bacterium]
MNASLLITSPLHRIATRLRLIDFWRWWSSELRAAFTPFIQNFLTDNTAITDIHTDGRALTIPRAEGSTVIPLDGVDSPDKTQQAIDQALRGQSRNVRLQLNPSLALIKPISYPQAAEENLRDVIGFDMDRQTPFKANLVYFDARITSRDSTKGTLQVELTAVPRTTIAPLLAPLRATGCTLSSLTIASQPPHCELLPADEKPARRLSLRQRLQIILLVVVGILTLAAIALPIWQKREAVLAQLPVVDRSRAEAEGTRRVEAEYQKLAQEYQYLVNRKQSLYPVVEVLEELTRLAPDTTWLQSLEIKTTPKAREVQLSGETESASKIIESLEKSPLLQNASQRSQTSRGSQPNLERFQITTETKPRPLPAVVNLIEPAEKSAPAANADSPTTPTNAAAEPAPAAPATSAPVPRTGPLAKPPGADEEPAYADEPETPETAPATPKTSSKTPAKPSSKPSGKPAPAKPSRP